MLRTNLTVLAAGSGAGLLLSWVVRLQAHRWLVGGSQNPALTAITAALLIVVAVAACIAPALSASMIQPNQVLHAE